jgi:hypothetical protein
MDVLGLSLPLLCSTRRLLPKFNRWSSPGGRACLGVFGLVQNLFFSARALYLGFKKFSAVTIGFASECYSDWYGASCSLRRSRGGALFYATCFASSNA